VSEQPFWPSAASHPQEGSSPPEDRAALGAASPPEAAPMGDTSAGQAVPAGTEEAGSWTGPWLPPLLAEKFPPSASGVAKELGVDSPVDPSEKLEAEVEKVTANAPASSPDSALGIGSELPCESEPVVFESKLTASESEAAAAEPELTSLAAKEPVAIEKGAPPESSEPMPVGGVQTEVLLGPDIRLPEVPLPPIDEQSRYVAETTPPVSTPPPPAQEKPPKSDQMEWYILKVQTNREESIREGLLRRAAIAGLDHYFGEIIIPTEKVTEFKGGKKRIISRKLYPGYLVIQMELNDDTWFLVRETPGIGDFTGAVGRPSPLPPHEVNRILAKKEERPGELPKLKIGFRVGDRVKITEGTFENFEGEVSSIDEANGRVTVMISIFNRTTPVEFEYWQLEKV